MIALEEELIVFTPATNQQNTVLIGSVQALLRVLDPLCLQTYIRTFDNDAEPNMSLMFVNIGE